MVLIMRRPVLALALMLFAICSCDHFENVDLAQESPDRAYVTPSFVDNGDGTVTDVSANGLIWNKCAFGESWDGSSCAGTPTAGPLANVNCGSDWRLPRKAELLTMTTGNYSGFFDEHGTSNYYWTTDVYAGDIMYVVQFKSSGLVQTYNKTSAITYARCVKTVQP